MPENCWQSECIPRGQPSPLKPKGSIEAKKGAFGWGEAVTGRKAKPHRWDIGLEAKGVKVRLHQFLSRTGHFSSKRDVKNAIWNGDITVNGSIVKDIAYQFNSRTKPVEYQGKRLHLPDADLIYVFHKPPGYLCARLNAKERAIGKRSVFDLFEGRVDSTVFARLLTVGRLDEATTGLLFITTSGDVVHRITAPEHHVAKRYWVSAKRPLTEEAELHLTGGVTIELEVDGHTSDYTTQPASIERVGDRDFILEVQEGKKRQVRRMVSAVGNAVEHLHRLSIAGATLDQFDLNEGAFVEVTSTQLEAWLTED